MPNRDIVFTLKFRNQAGQVIRKFGSQLKVMGADSQKAGARLGKLALKFRMLGDAVVKAGRRIKSAGAAIREAGTNIAFSIGVPIATAVAISVKAFADFDLALAGVQKTVQGTPEQLAGLEAGFIRLSNKIPIAATQLASIAQTAGQLGVAIPDILSFTETIAKVGVATKLSTEQAAFALARLSNIMQIPTSQVNNLASSLIALGNNFEANETEILNLSVRLAKAGKVVGLTAGEVLGLSSALAAVGVRAQAGGTAVSKALTNMSKAVELGGAKVAEFARIAGLSVDEFSRLFKEDAASAFNLFIVGLGKTIKSGRGVFTVMEDLGLQASRTQRAIIGLALASGKLKEALDLGNRAFIENTALNKEAEIFFAALSSQMKILKQRFMNAAAILGKSFGPVIVEIIKVLSEFALKLQDFAKRMDSLTPATKKWIVTILAALVALGPLLIFLGSIIAVAGALVAAVGALIPVFVAIGPAAATAFAFITGPVGWAIAAITLASVVLFKFRNNLVTVGDKTVRVRDIIVAAWNIVVEQVAFVAKFMRSIFGDAILWLQLKFSGLGESFDSLTDDAMPAFITFLNMVRAVGNAIIGGFQVVALEIIIAFKSAMKLMENLADNAVIIAGNLGDAFIAMATGAEAADVIDALFRGTKSPVEGIAKATADEFSEIEKIFAGKKDFLGDFGKLVFERAFADTKKTIVEENAVGEGLKEVLDKTSVIVEDGGGRAGDLFGVAFNKGMEAAFADFIKEAADIAQLTEDAFKNAFSNIEDALLDFIETGKFNFRDFAQSILREFNKIAIKSIMGDIALKLQGKEASSGGFLAGIGNLLSGGTPEEGPAVPAGFVGGDKVGQGPGGIIGAVTAGTEAIGGFFTNLGDNFATGLEGIGNLFQDGLKGLGDIFSSIGGFFSGSGGGGGGAAAGGGSLLEGIGKFLVGAAAEGGISDSLTNKKMVSIAAFANAKGFAQGGVTSGTDRIPALLSRNEAVVPLSRNRAIPVEGMGGGTTNITFNIETADAESFKQSRSQMLARVGVATDRAKRKTM